jgi:hypothetical protein
MAVVALITTTAKYSRAAQILINHTDALTLVSAHLHYQVVVWQLTQQWYVQVDSYCVLMVSAGTILNHAQYSKDAHQTCPYNVLMENALLL